MSHSQDKIDKYVKQYTIEQLLSLALGMLDEAAKREAKSRMKNKFLQNNLTLEVIRAKVHS